MFRAYLIWTLFHWGCPLLVLGILKDWLDGFSWESVCPESVVYVSDLILLVISVTNLCCSIAEAPDNPCQHPLVVVGMKIELAIRMCSLPID